MVRRSILLPLSTSKDPPLLAVVFVLLARDSPAGHHFGKLDMGESFCFLQLLCTDFLLLKLSVVAGLFWERFAHVINLKGEHDFMSSVRAFSFLSCAIAGSILPPSV